MKPPTDEIREEVARRAFAIAEEADDQRFAEQQLAELLDWVWAQIDEWDPYEEINDVEESMAAVESWLSVASYPVAVFYAPQSPFKKWSSGTLAGMAPKVTTRVTRIVTALKSHVVSVAQAAGVDDAGVSFQYPWGVGAGVSWAINQPPSYPRITMTRYPALTNAGHEFDIEVDPQTTVTATSPD